MGSQRQRSGRVSFRDHFHAYLGVLRACGTSAGGVADVERRVRRVARQCGFVRLADVGGEAVREWLSVRRAEGMPASGCNAHLEALSQFVAWCVRTGRLAGNPLKGVCHLEEVEGTEGGSRPLSEEELGRLLRIALGRPLAEYGRVAAPSGGREDGGAARFVPVTVEGLEALVARGRRLLRGDAALIARLQRQGWQRALIYKTMALTGLRRSELVSLKIGSLAGRGSRLSLRTGVSGAGTDGGKVEQLAHLAAGPTRTRPKRERINPLS